MTRFKLTQENPNVLAAHRLNHSATSAWKLHHLYIYYYLIMCLSARKLNDSGAGSTIRVALSQNDLFFLNIQTQTSKKKMIEFLI